MECLAALAKITKAQFITLFFGRVGGGRGGRGGGAIRPLTPEKCTRVPVNLGAKGCWNISSNVAFLAACSLRSSHRATEQYAHCLVTFLYLTVWLCEVERRLTHFSNWSAKHKHIDTIFEWTFLPAELERGTKMLQFAGPWACRGKFAWTPLLVFKNFIHYQAVLFKCTTVCNWYTSLTAIAVHTSCYALLYFYGGPAGEFTSCP